MFRGVLKVSRVRQARMSEGSEFQVVAAATEKARRARSVLVLVADPLPDWQPVKRPEWTGICSTSTLADDSGRVVLRSLQCVECCGRRTEQYGVAVVQPGSDNDTASHCLILNFVDLCSCAGSTWSPTTWTSGSTLPLL